MDRRNKAAVRRAVRAAYPSKEARDRESAALCAHVLSWPPYQRAQIVGGYVPMLREADVTPILLDVLQSGRTLALPRIEGDGSMTFRRVDGLDRLIPGAYGLSEPPPESEVIPDESIGLIIAPVEAVTRDGMRLGKGGGYYDRLLAKGGVPALGAVMSWQWVRELPVDPWDRPLTAAADADGIYEWQHLI